MKKRLCLFLLFCVLVSVPMLQAQEKATPEAGEGISTFLLRHNRAPKKYYDDFMRLNKKKLGKDGSLKLGETYLIPPAKSSSKKGAKQSEKSVKENPEPKTEAKSSKKKGQETEEQEPVEKPRKAGKSKIYEPLFGSDLANVRVTSSRLAGACFYLVSGHGGPDPGAIGQVGNVELHEDEYAYDIILRLARNLLEEGAEVRIIIQDAKDGIRDDAYLSNSKRETCMGDPIPLNQVERLRQRCEKINASYRKDRKNYNYCRAIFVHVDSRSKGMQTDVFFYHSMQKAESKRLAHNMKDTFESKYGKHQPDRGFTGTVSGRSLYVLSCANPVSVFVELGNIQNTFDQRRLVIPSNRQALAKWLKEGFIKDYKSR